MRELGVRRTWARLLAGATVVAGLALTGVAAPAMAATATTEAGTTVGTDQDEGFRRTLEGTWHGKVRTSIPSTGEATLTFLPDGTLGAPDQGTWKDGRHGAFSFTLRYDRFDEQGNRIGYTEGHHNGEIAYGNKTFTSEGTTTVYNLDGSVVRTFQLYIDATRLAG